MQVAHRTAMILACDVVVVLEGGRVIECGNPQSLLQQQSSSFATLYAADQEGS